MGLGNRIGFTYDGRVDRPASLFEPMYGSIVLEMVSDSPARWSLLGETTKEYMFECCGEKLAMAELQEIWAVQAGARVPLPQGRRQRGEDRRPAGCSRAPPRSACAKPKVIIPVFPGTNCEYDTAARLCAGRRATRRSSWSAT